MVTIVHFMLCGLFFTIIQKNVSRVKVHYSKHKIRMHSKFVVTAKGHGAPFRGDDMFQN